MRGGPTLMQRPNGAGCISRAPKGRPGWLARGPKVAGKTGQRLGHFDRYRDAERALEALASGKR